MSYFTHLYILQDPSPPFNKKNPYSLYISHSCLTFFFINNYYIKKNK